MFLNKIETAIKNKILYTKYLEDFSKIDNDVSEDVIKEKLNISKDRFKKLESKLLNKVKISDDVYNISVDLCVYYRSPRGRNNYSKNKIITFLELEEIYNKWLRGKNYEINSKIERSIMNDDIRYNVLKRDNFTCVLCGATSKDGVKLQIDHIIPLSKGGKTTMSNLRTLCDRCNRGKSSKIENNNTICPKWGGNLILRVGRYGKFMGCSNYPKCHYTREI